MGEIAFLKIINVIGLSVFSFAFITNLLAWLTDISKYANGVLSIMLGIIGGIWVYWRAMEKREDTLIKRVGREDLEDDHKEKRKVIHK